MKNTVIYQVYPKSFYDTTGDGVGDLNGVKEKLPYLRELGIDMIWLNPFYPSPQRDNGYDISDYCAIDPRFGTMADFEALVKQAKALHIEIMLDMVLNHVSTDHEWFQKALAGEKKYQDYFILRDTPTNWQSKFGGNAWAKFGDTDRYYLHLYDPTQADLNWHNPEVREELFNVVRFWMEKGVKGFRFDVINVIGKDVVLKDAADQEGKFEYTDRPIAHDFIHELNRQTFGADPTIITVGEMSSTTVPNGILYTRPDREELTMIFNFHHLKVDYENGQKWTDYPFDFKQLTSILHEWGEGMSEGDGWNALFWNNHDQPRALNRFVDVENYRIRGAQMLAATMHLNRGTPFIYMGEEIGMVDPDYRSIDDFEDIESKNAYQMLMDQGKTAEEALHIVSLKSRDNARTPMQWDSSTHAGFSKGQPWLKVGNHADITVEHELNDPKIFGFYQELIRLRKTYEVIAEGDYEAYAKDHDQVFAYVRQTEDAELLVLNNYYGDQTTIEIPERFVAGEILLTNVDKTTLESNQRLEPYQTLAILVKK
ncbi:alpha,alpha-phosphotrehalase [Enterococcus bulliens]